MLRAAFFDFYGTLAGWQPAGERIQADAARAEGLDVSPEAVRDAYPVANAYLDSLNAQSPVAGRPRVERDALFAEYERRLLAAAGVEATLEAAARVWTRVDAAPKEFAPYPEALPTLAEMRAMGLKTGVISNMGTDLLDTLVQMGLAAALDVQVTSGEVGVGKPHRAIFDAALARASVRAGEAIHVGDSYEGDVLGAQQAGLHALLLERVPLPTVPAASPRVSHLGEVAAYLRKRGLVAAT